MRMTRAFPLFGRAVLIAALGAITSACSGNPRPAGRTVAVRASQPVVQRPVSQADVNFMAGMIPHHAQAVKMAGWAKANGARSDIQILAARIVVAQRDEIAIVQTWLRDRNQAVPDASATRHRMMMNGMEHDMLMPGMMSDEEMARLERARGAEFDRLFLTYMIRHHEGAITMVDELFASYGAAQDEVVFRFASDVYADQTTEIHFMQEMLAEMTTTSRQR